MKPVSIVVSYQLVDFGCWQQLVSRGVGVLLNRGTGISNPMKDSMRSW